MLSTYGDQIRFVWRDFPLRTAQSPKAAEAGQCANAQGKFWPYHDYLYDNTPALTTENLKAAAATLGLDRAQFDRCLDSGQMAAKVQASWDEAVKMGLPGTPAFLINGKPFIGPPTFQQMRNLIDPLLAKGG